MITLCNQVEYMKTYQNQKLYQRLINQSSLPPFPDVAMRALNQIQNPDCTFTEVHKCLILDPALVALILKVANSPLYPVQKEITNINQALSYMGFRRIRSMLYTYLYRTLMEKGASRFPGQLKFWNHSLAVGLYAQILAIQTDYEDDSECFTAGLIHDIGRFIIGVQDPKLFKEIETTSQTNGLTLLEAEQRILGFTHQDVGYGIARKWNFPDKVVDCIALHHELMEFDNLPKLVRIVSVANLLDHMRNEGVDSDYALKVAQYLQRLNLDESTQQGIQVLFEEKINSIRSLF